LCVRAVGAQREQSQAFGFAMQLGHCSVLLGGWPVVRSSNAADKETVDMAAGVRYWVV
jgi:hypothetical protein